MKLVLFDDIRLGILKDGLVTEVTDVAGSFRSGQELMEHVINTWNVTKARLEAAAQGRKNIPATELILSCPLPHPGKFVCVAANYLEFGQRPPQELDAFLKGPTSALGPFGTIILPPVPATVFHHEAELGVVIGKTASYVKAPEAMDYVFGYLNFIDVSARGFRPMGRNSFFLGKARDTFAPMGPCIVTADEIPDPHSLDVKLWVDGQLRHDFNTNDMAHHIPELLEYFSTGMTLEPGDVLATGSNHQGVGPIQHGEMVEMEIDGLERLTVYVRDDLRREWPKEIDKAMADRAAGRS